MDNTRCLVWLTSLVGLRSVSLRRLLAHFETASAVHEAEEEAYHLLTWLRPAERELLKNKNLAAADKILSRCEDKGIGLLTLQEEDYPERLREISDPPAILYVRGRLPAVDDLPLLALVGTRRPSPYGVKMAKQLAEDLSVRGFVTVTGMAKGIDGVCADTSLRSGGTVIGVLGCAIDEYYPKENRELIDEVAARGAIVSEFPPGYPTLPSNFPRRNRLISGLSCGACVIEAPVRSGALITGNLAVDQGRDLFVVPSPADSASGRGSNRLLQSCGKLCMSAEDIAEEYESLFPHILHTPVRPAGNPAPAREDLPGKNKKNQTEVDKEETIPYITLRSRWENFSPEEQGILESLVPGEKQVDEIILQTGFPSARVLSLLTMLTIAGAVKALPGKRYTLNL